MVTTERPCFVIYSRGFVYSYTRTTIFNTTATSTSLQQQQQQQQHQQQRLNHFDYRLSLHPSAVAVSCLLYLQVHNTSSIVALSYPCYNWNIEPALPRTCQHVTHADAEIWLAFFQLFDWPIQTDTSPVPCQPAPMPSPPPPLPAI